MSDNNENKFADEFFKWWEEELNKVQKDPSYFQSMNSDIAELQQNLWKNFLNATTSNSTPSDISSKRDDVIAKLNDRITILEERISELERKLK